MSSQVGLRIINNLQRLPLGIKPLHLRCISTKKNSDTASVASAVKSEAVCETKPKNWISYGFSTTDYDEDRHFTHMTIFLGVTVLMVFGGFFLAYRPDYLGRDWAQREAFLELRRREKDGLPLVNPNYVPLDKIVLPSDEELGDTEIVI